MMSGAFNRALRLGISSAWNMAVAAYSLQTAVKSASFLEKSCSLLPLPVVSVTSRLKTPQQDDR